MMNCNRNRQMVKRRIYSFQMDGESRAEASVVPSNSIHL